MLIDHRDKLESPCVLFNAHPIELIPLKNHFTAEPETVGARAVQWRGGMLLQSLA